MKKIKEYLQKKGIKFVEKGNTIIIKTNAILEWVNGFNEIMRKNKEYRIVYNTNHNWHNYTISYDTSFAETASKQFKKYQDTINFLEQILED